MFFQFRFFVMFIRFHDILFNTIWFPILGEHKVSNENHKEELNRRIACLEKQIFSLTGNDRVKARIEYDALLDAYRKECGLEESIYLVRA